MTNTTYFEPYRSDESSVSTSSDASDEHAPEEVAAVRGQPSRSLYSGIRKRVGALIHHKKLIKSDDIDTELYGIDKNLTRYSYSELRTITGDFKILIGNGGSAIVYKGMLSDGREVAVKKLTETYLSNSYLEEFKTELSLIPTLQHRNIVRLYGFCSEGENRLLVYEYLQNGSLFNAVHEKTLHLDWRTRYKICLGVARGLAYIHEESMPKIIHRDVKPHNILLDFDLNPKICDFGTSRQHADEDTPISTLVAGTMGYLDPDYFCTGRLTEKADVYSFGVTSLQILSGRRAINLDGEDEFRNLVSLAVFLNSENRGLELVDPSLTTFHKEQALQMLEVAFMCINLQPNERPTMSQVVIMLMRSYESEHGFSGSSTHAPQSTQLQSEHGTSGSPIPKVPTTPLQSVSNLYMGHGADLTTQLTQKDDFAKLIEMKDLLTSFRYDELREATGDFSPSNKLGHGGFGPVYMGILSDERKIAVKKLSKTSHQGNNQFLAEVFTISAVQHQNIVKLYGYCIEDENRLLVYEYLANKSLDQALFGKNAVHLDWTARHNICLGIARGLACFHEESDPRIIHRDVKSSNILLDNDLNPKISDFGLAKLFGDTKTHISTRFGGTIGYIAPEYAMCGRLTEKADVYAFGVVALEILCGRPINDSRLGPGKTYLLELVWNLYENDRSLELVDTTLKSFNKEEAIRMLGVALLCTQASPKTRPTISQVVGMLTGASEVTVAEKPSYLRD